MHLRTLAHLYVYVCVCVCVCVLCVSQARLEMALRAELESQVGQLQSVNDQLAAKLSERTQEVAQLRDQMVRDTYTHTHLAIPLTHP